MFVDTPGIHRPLHRMNVRMVDAAVETLREVDVVVLVFDASTRPGHGDEYVSKLLQDVKMPVVLVLNKIDLVAKTRLLPLIEQAADVARRSRRSCRCRRRPATASTGWSGCCSSICPRASRSTRTTT